MQNKSHNDKIQEFIEMIKLAQEKTGCQIVATIQSEKLGEAVLSKPVLRVVVDPSHSAHQIQGPADPPVDQG